MLVATFICAAEETAPARGAIGDFFNSTVDAISNAVETVVNTVVDTAVDYYEEFTSSVSETVSDVSDAVVDWWEDEDNYDDDDDDDEPVYHTYIIEDDDHHSSSNSNSNTTQSTNTQTTTTNTTTPQTNYQTPQTEQTTSLITYFFPEPTLAEQIILENYVDEMPVITMKPKPTLTDFSISNSKVYVDDDVDIKITGKAGESCDGAGIALEIFEVKQENEIKINNTCSANESYLNTYYSEYLLLSGHEANHFHVEAAWNNVTGTEKKFLNSVISFKKAGTYKLCAKMWACEDGTYYMYPEETNTSTKYIDHQGEVVYNFGTIVVSEQPVKLSPVTFVTGSTSGQVMAGSKSLTKTTAIANEAVDKGKIVIEVEGLENSSDVEKIDKTFSSGADVKTYWKGDRLESGNIASHLYIVFEWDDWAKGEEKYVNLEMYINKVGNYNVYKKAVAEIDSNEYFSPKFTINNKKDDENQPIMHQGMFQVLYNPTKVDNIISNMVLDNGITFLELDGINDEEVVVELIQPWATNSTHVLTMGELEELAVKVETNGWEYNTFIDESDGNVVMSISDDSFKDYAKDIIDFVRESTTLGATYIGGYCHRLPEDDQTGCYIFWWTYLAACVVLTPETGGLSMVVWARINMGADVTMIGNDFYSLCESWETEERNKYFLYLSEDVLYLFFAEIIANFARPTYKWVSKTGFGKYVGNVAGKAGRKIHLILKPGTEPVVNTFRALGQKFPKMSNRIMWVLLPDEVFAKFSIDALSKATMDAKAITLMSEMIGEFDMKTWKVLYGDVPNFKNVKLQPKIMDAVTFNQISDNILKYGYDGDVEKIFLSKSNKGSYLMEVHGMLLDATPTVVDSIITRGTEPLAKTVDGGALLKDDRVVIFEAKNLADDFSVGKSKALDDTIVTENHLRFGQAVDVNLKNPLNPTEESLPHWATTDGLLNAYNDGNIVHINIIRGYDSTGKYGVLMKEISQSEIPILKDITNSINDLKTSIPGNIGGQGAPRKASKIDQSVIQRIYELDRKYVKLIEEAL